MYALTFSRVFYGTRSVHVAFTCNIVWNRARYNCMCGHGMLCTCAFKAIASWYCCQIFQVIFTKVINKKFGVRSNILSTCSYVQSSTKHRQSLECFTIFLHTPQTFVPRQTIWQPSSPHNPTTNYAMPCELLRIKSCTVQLTELQVILFYKK